MEFTKGLNQIVFLVLLCSGICTTNMLEPFVTGLFTDCTALMDFFGVTYPKIAATNPPAASNIDLVLYGRSFENKSVVNLQNAGNVLMTNPLFNSSLPTDIFMHGIYLQPDNPEMIFIVKTLINKGGSNVIYVDASKIIGFWYLYSITASKFIGDYLGKELVALVGQGYDKSKIHLIGLSLGAHIVGYAGKTFKSLTGGSLPWITGLDPAGPCFYNSLAPDRLDAADADFVDVIHTCMGLYGTTQNIGDADFYPNSGRDQPNTVTPLGSHAYALQFYVESIVNRTSFTAVKCKNWDNFKYGGCTKNSRTVMGYGVSNLAAGKYYLITNGASPFGKGDAGIPPFNLLAALIEWYWS